MIRSKLIKWLKWGLACCMLVPFLAWQAKDTSFQPTDTKGFIAEMQKQFAEVQTIKKKENHREELERKVRDTHRMLMHDYPVYYDWWLQDGNDAKDIKDGKDVNWFRGSFSRQLSLRMQKLNITTAVNDNPGKYRSRFPVLSESVREKTCRTSGNFHCQSGRDCFYEVPERCVLLSLPIPKAFPMPVQSATTLQAVRCRRLR